ncbi:class II aldolase/adducin family protein [Calycomorphotria hydatis]|uniref:Methylthioribulose-1-phosphate dehydratase n=1 Tax=Calycomorphotria hydatis TaxID=2528027 RepID=A0A517T3J5_9PLAN|nr:class II aldolase/adducin family protein [Calycomorphotria hydatis]QDT62911.1 Methylthioribulose-1-phosphate dehydratase [Calycomorphotria hydatis]
MQANRWNSGIHDRRIKEEICEIGRRVYNKNFVAANDGNISYRVGENEVLCSPTMISKGFMKPEDICAVDLDGNQIAGQRKRTSEILLHLSIMRARPDVKAVVHCHPPHALAFAIAGEPIPQCILPEIEVFIGQVPIAPFETPGSQTFADSVLPYLEGTNTIMLKNHGTVSFGETLEDAYWKTESLDQYCRVLLLTKQLGRPVDYLNEEKMRELLNVKKDYYGIDDPRFYAKDCDLCGNDVMQPGYKEEANSARAFNPAPSFPGYLQTPACEPSGCSTPDNLAAMESAPSDDESLVQAITDQVMVALGK